VKHYVSDSYWCDRDEQFKHSLVCLYRCTDQPYCSHSLKFEYSLRIKLQSIALARIGGNGQLPGMESDEKE